MQALYASPWIRAAYVVGPARGDGALLGGPLAVRRGLGPRADAGGEAFAGAAAAAVFVSLAALGLALARRVPALPRVLRCPYNPRLFRGDDESPRIPGQGDPRALRRRRAARRGHRQPGRGAGDREALGGRAVVKAQIHAGGRGKGGGVKLAKDPEEAARPRQEDPRHDARHAPDRARGPASSRRCWSRRRSTSHASSTSASRSTARSACPS